MIRKIQAEIDLMTERLFMHRKYQKLQKFELDSITTVKTGLTAKIRDYTGQIPTVSEKRRLITKYLQEDGPQIFNKEKMRNAQLLTASFELKQKLIRKNLVLKDDLADAMLFQEETRKATTVIKATKAEVAAVLNKLEDDAAFVKSDYQNLLKQTSEKRAIKLETVQRTVQNEAISIAKETELLKLAMERRKAMGGKVDAIKDLDNLNLSGAALVKVQRIQIDSSSST
jgi:hypothetical protein